MTDLTSSQSIEEKLYAANRVLPRPEFLAGLRARLAEKPPRPLTLNERVRLAFRRPAWVLTVGILLVLMVALALAGPQRVLAALQGIFGYIPRVGFISKESAAALKKPVELAQNGQTFQVEQLLASSKETVMVLHIQGFPAYQDIGLDHGISLTLADGSALLPQSYGIDSTGTPGEYTGVFKFQPLPVATRQITVTWKRSPEVQSSEPANWQIPVTLFPISDPDLAKLLPNSYMPDNASTTYQGITLKIDQISTTLSDTAVHLQMIFPEVFDSASPNAVVLMDEKGGTYQSQKGQVYFEDNGQSPQVLTTPGPTPKVFKSLLETLSFPAINPAVKQLALQVNQLNFRASPYVTFTVDLGSRPSVSDRWSINQLISIGDIPIRVNFARLISLSKDAPGGNGKSMTGLVLDIDPVNPGQVQLNQIWLRIWGAQHVYDPATTTWVPAWSPDQVPSGVVEIHLDIVQGILFGDWKIQWAHQKP